VKPRWTIRKASALLCPLGRWEWWRQDVNGRAAAVGCVCHHSWTKRVKAFVEVPE
jgi:hypothetical protein